MKKFLNNQLIDFKELNLNESHFLIEVLQRLYKEGVGSTIVGGAVRDWLLNGELSEDIDIEIYPLNSTLSLVEWEKLRESLIDHFSFEKLPFKVLKLEKNNLSIEFVPARKENYSKGKNFGHSEFQVEFLLDADYKESFKRRDFTLNSLGLEYGPGQFKLVDPFFGIGDLEKKILRTVNPDFEKDPVRYLRMIRFSLLYDLKISNETLIRWKNISLDKVSFYYLRKESEKSKNCSSFFERVFLIAEQKQMNLGEKLNRFKMLNFNVGVTRTVEELLLCNIYSDGLNENVKSTIDLFQLKEKKLKNFSQLVESFKALEELQQIPNEYTELKTSQLFEPLKNLFQILRREGGDFLKLFEDLEALNLCYRESLQKSITIPEGIPREEWGLFKFHYLMASRSR